MAPIRVQQKKKEREPEPVVDLSSRFPSFQLQSYPVSSDWWNNFSKRISEGSSEAKFESFLKISMNTFGYICGLVEDEMLGNTAKYTDLSGKILNLHDRVAIALRRLSSGESLASTRDLLGVHPSTVSSLTWRFVEAMEKRALHHIGWPSSNIDDMRNLKQKFERIRGLPNCCGAIATTNIMFTCPSSAGDSCSRIWCHKCNNASMILQAVVDPEMRFLDVVTGFPGSFSDTEVLKSSYFYKLSEEGKRLNGDKIKLFSTEVVVELREYIVGHDGLPLLPWLLTPYHGKLLSRVENNYNECHNMTWQVARHAVAKLKENWGIIQGVMWRPDKHKLPRIILVCCLLHNIMIDLGDGIHFPDNVDDDEDEEEQEHRQPFGHSPDMAAASAQRENLAFYLSANLPS